MLDKETPFLAQLSEQERVHFRNLALLRPQLPSEGQLQLVEGLARSLNAPRLLTLIARTPHWLIHGPILNALSQNEATPEPIRRDLEMAVSLFDLMREADRARLPHREEYHESAKSLYQQLPPDLKPIVKQQLKMLARPVSASGSTQELPPLPTETPDWEQLTLPPEAVETYSATPVLSLEEQVSRAGQTLDPAELEALLLEGEEEVWRAGLRNPMITEEFLCGVLPRATSGGLLEEVYSEARWYFRESIREVIYSAPACPEPLARDILRTQELICLLEGPPPRGAELRRVVSLFSQIEEADYQFVTYWAKRKAPALLRVVKIFYDRLQRKRALLATGMAPTGGEGQWASLEERVFLANQGTQPDQLMASLRDPDLQVFRVVLENPGLTPRELLAAVPGMARERAELLACHRLWGENSTVVESLLHNIHLSAFTARQLLARLSTPRALLDLLRDSRLPHMEVRQEALEMLRRLYQGMSSPDRILALRLAGGELIRQLPQEVLRDEDALLLLVADRQMDPSILLRLARNKQTPRSVLERIGAHPILMAHPPIMSELLLNPKTPRETSIRIWGLLSETEQQALLASPHLPATLRHLG
nr:hypothetical protein [uncultured Holophaga sp.]